MRTKLLLISFILFGLATPAGAATAVKMTSLKPLIPIALSGDSGDQITSLITSPTSILLAGTVASDGYVASFDRTGVQQWSLRLGGASDEIVTAAARDTSGVLWIAGATSVTPPPTSLPTPSGSVLNPGGVVVETSTAIAALTQLNIWKVSSKGLLLNSFALDFTSQIYPQSISVKNGKATIQGAISSNALDQFAVTVDSLGVFTKPRVVSVKTSAPTQVIQVKTKLSLWKSFVTSVAIKGLPSWKPKPSSHVLIRYDLKTNAVLAAYLASGEILDFKQEPTIGVVVLGSNAAGYYLAIIK